MRSPGAGPGSSTRWAELGDIGRDDIERYAYYRVGYHRGLDALRANGWRGSGYVRWSAPTNRGFLRALAGLGAMAAAIGEDDEAERVATFLAQLDPDGPPAPARDAGRTRAPPAARRRRALRRGAAGGWAPTRRSSRSPASPMAERVATALEPAGCDPVVLVGGDGALLARFGRPRRRRPLPR